MWAISVIVFRESLEAALFVGIVAAAARGLSGRGPWLAAGVAAGVLGALALAAGAQTIGQWADGVGQELVNVGILSLALLMLFWHCVWASAQGRQMAQDAKALGAQARQQARRPWALTLAVALAVLREGAETVLFVLGLTSGAEHSATSVAGAVALGLLGGVTLGSALYLGLARIKAQHVFAVTQGLVWLLAASLASQLARTLMQAGWMDWGTQVLWDSSRWLALDSVWGKLLHSLVGYEAQPSLLQAVFYALAIALLWSATGWVRRHTQRRPTP